MSKGNRGHHSLRWVYCPQAEKPGQILLLDPAHAKHLTGVLRMEDGTPLMVTNGAGKVYRGELQGGGKSAAIALEDEVPQPPRPAAGFRVALGLPKNPVADAVVEKLAELGCRSFEPFQASRSVVKPGRGDEEKYSKRWQSIAVEALEQSQQGWLLDVKTPVSFAVLLAAIGAFNGASFLFASESRDSSSLGDAAREMTQAAAQGGELLLILGPEGGFSVEEREALVGAGCRELSLGPSVLRVETAVVAAATLACLALDQAGRHT